MTELHHFHSARKGSGSLRPFPIYPLYTQAEILSLDKPIADCFLFRPRKRLEKRRKRSHTNVFNASVIRTSRVSQTLLHPPSLLPSMGTTRQKSSCRNRLQNGPHSLLRMKVGTLPTGSHTAAYTAKQGPSGQGRYHYPRSVPHVHKYPRAGCQNGVLCRFLALAGGAPKERREPSGQRCAYARRCSEGVAAPLGCVVCLQLGDVAVFSLCAQYFLNVRGGGGITPLGALCMFSKRRTAACKSG